MLDKERGLYIAHCANGALSITGKMANRHGLIAGATGTGKTVTLQVMAETFCQAGVPCFMADMKGDLSGISQVGKLSGFIEKLFLKSRYVSMANEMRFALFHLRTLKPSSARVSPMTK